MKTDTFLEEMLEHQKLGEDSDELKSLRDHRDMIETTLRNHFGSLPTIRYGGSHAKGTLIKDSYDLDIICYFSRDDTSAGDTLKEIYEKVSQILSEEWYVEKKTSALRVQSKERVDFHIDVVPGRFINEKGYDTFLYCANGDKERLLTNIQKHIDHVKDSGVTDVIRLIKLWRSRNGVSLKTFALELLVIEILSGAKSGSLDDKMKTVLQVLADDTKSLSIKDPANSEGNDLSEIWNNTIQKQVAAIARSSMASFESLGWAGILGSLPLPENDSKLDDLRRTARVSTSSTKPWLHSED